MMAYGGAAFATSFWTKEVVVPARKIDNWIAVDLIDDRRFVKNFDLLFLLFQLMWLSSCAFSGPVGNGLKGPYFRDDNREILGLDVD